MNYLNDTITLQTNQGARMVPMRVFGEWGVHRTLEADDVDRRFRWTITHLPTGRAVALAPSLSWATKAAKRLEPHRIRLDENGKPHSGEGELVFMSCAGCLVWINVGRDLWRTPADMPDIMAWTREEVA